MQITIFGASGKIGKLVTSELLIEGHSVVAFAHKSDLKPQANLKIAKGDIHSSEDIQTALQGSDLVISTLGSWHTKSKDILATAMTSVVPLMDQQGIKRIITLTGSDARASGDRPKLLAKLMRPMLKIAAGKILFDGEEHIRILEASKLDYTVVRSPVMRGIGPSGKAGLNFKAPNVWETVHRKDVAKAICSLVENQQLNRQCPFVH